MTIDEIGAKKKRSKREKRENSGGITTKQIMKG